MATSLQGCSLAIWFSRAPPVVSMDVTLYSARDFPANLATTWRELARAEPHLDHPLLTHQWVELVAAVQPHIEIAVLKQGAAIAGFLPFERRGRQGYPVAACLSDLHGLVSSTQLRIDPAELLRNCGLSVLH